MNVLSESWWQLFAQVPPFVTTPSKKTPIDSGQTKAMLMNADRDLLDLRGGYIPQDAYTLLGVVTERLGIEEQAESLVR